MASNATSAAGAAAAPAAEYASMNFNNTLGAILVGGLACAVLYGITCIQTFVYFQRNSHPGERVRWLVAALWLLDTFDFVLTSHILYWYLVNNFMNPLAMEQIVWSLLAHAAVTSVSDLAVRMMFTIRVYSLSHGSILLCGVIIALSILDFVCGLVITIRGAQIISYTALGSIREVFWLNFAAGFTSDFFVAISLSIFLYRSKTGFKRTDSIVNALLAYTINTGFVTALCEILGMIFYLLQPNNFIFFSFYLLLSKLYLNAYLASLNARGILRETLHSNDLVSIHLTDITGVSVGPVRFASGQSHGRSSSTARTSQSRPGQRRSLHAVGTPGTEVVDVESRYPFGVGGGVRRDDDHDGGEDGDHGSMHSEHKAFPLEISVRTSVMREYGPMVDTEMGERTPSPVTATTLLPPRGASS